MNRISVVGTSGSGKTTFAAELARILGHRHIELDVLHWAPNWVEKPDDEFLELVREATQGERWITDGNYSKTQPTVLSLVDTVIWLDYPFLTVWRRAIWRTFSRVFTREKIWHDNVETWRTAFSRYGIPAWVVRSYGKNKRKYSGMIERGYPEGVYWVRLRSPKATETFLQRLRDRSSDA